MIHDNSTVADLETRRAEIPPLLPIEKPLAKLPLDGESSCDAPDGRSFSNGLQSALRA